MLNCVADFAVHHAEFGNIRLRFAFMQILPNGLTNFLTVSQHGIVEAAKFANALAGGSARHDVLMLVLKREHALHFGC